MVQRGVVVERMNERQLCLRRVTTCQNGTAAAEAHERMTPVSRCRGRDPSQATSGECTIRRVRRGTLRAKKRQPPAAVVE